jgi:hypothetical protein
MLLHPSFDGQIVLQLTFLLQAYVERCALCLKRNNAQRRARNRGANPPLSEGDQGGLLERRGASSYGENRDFNQGLGPRAPRKDGTCQTPGRATHICPEAEEGNVEYKLRLKDPTPHRFQQLVCLLLNDLPWSRHEERVLGQRGARNLGLRLYTSGFWGSDDTVNMQRSNA